MCAAEVLRPQRFTSHPALGALLAHLPGIVLALVMVGAGLTLPAWLLALGIGVSAAALAAWWRLPVWWLAINLLFVPALWLTARADLDPGWFLAGFVLLALTSLGAIRHRVPLYLSSARAAEALAQRLPPASTLIDLGCGLGGPLARVARLRPDVRLVGVESAPLNWLLARLRLAGRAEIRLANLWRTHLDEADVVYAYLSPAAMPRLWRKANAEMRPGSLLVSNSFAIPNAVPHEIVEVDDLSRTRLLIWRMTA